MITHVIVRSPERWCEGAKRHINEQARKILLRHSILEIDTNTAQDKILPGCPEISWMIAGEARKSILEMNPDSGLRVCCHVVEVD